MEIEAETVRALRFPDGRPVRAASAVARLGDGWLIIQDDATHAAWWRDETISAVRVQQAVEGLDLFDEDAGTKYLKPDFEAACEVTWAGVPAVLLLGSGSGDRRTRASLVSLVGGEPGAVVTELAPLYAGMAKALGVDSSELNMEGACIAGRYLRWFQRGRPSAGLPSASVDLALPDVMAAVSHGVYEREIGVSGIRHYELGHVDGVGLAVTDAVSLGGDALLLSAAAEDSPNPRDDGPVVGSALVRLEGTMVTDIATLPRLSGHVAKVEGLSVLEQTGEGVRLLATVDADDPRAASLAVQLRVRW